MEIKDIKVKNVKYTDDKVIVTDNKNNKYIVVLYSPDYGAALGWNEKDMPNINTNPELVRLVLSYSDGDKIIEWFEDNDLFYPGRISHELVPYGEYYYITEYDGWENVVTQNNMEIAK